MYLNILFDAIPPVISYGAKCADPIKKLLNFLAELQLFIWKQYRLFTLPCDDFSICQLCLVCDVCF